MNVDHGPWDPLPLAEAVDLFRKAPFRWWVSGGHALELHVGRSWRSHDDTDISFCRDDARHLPEILAGWDLHVAAGGVLAGWQGAALAADLHQNNLWGRPAVDSPWRLDLTVSGGDHHDWVFRRDPAIRVPWNRAVLHSPTGVPYLAPELQLLFKSRDRRPKDDADADAVVPHLDSDRLTFLMAVLGCDHPWFRADR